MDARHRCSGSLCRSQTARIGHCHHHGTGQHIAGAQGIGTGDREHPAGDLLKCTIQGHQSILSDPEIGCIDCGEQQTQQHGGAVPDDRHFLAGGDLVSLFHLQHTDRAGRFGPHILPVHDLLIVALGLFQGDLGFFYIGGSIGTVHCIQNRALLHHIAFLKISRQDLAVHQRGDRIGLGRFQGAHAAQGVGNILHLGRILHILRVCGHLLLRAALQRPEQDQRRQHTGCRDQPFCVLFQERPDLTRPHRGAALALLRSRSFFFVVFVHVLVVPPNLTGQTTAPRGFCLCLRTAAKSASRGRSAVQFLSISPGPFALRPSIFYSVAHFGTLHKYSPIISRFFKIF